MQKCPRSPYYRKRSVGIRHAIKALFDRGISIGAEMDYYCDYPMKQIVEIVEANGPHVSAELMLLVARADRSRHEDPGQTGITDEEIALFNHISKRHKYLSRRYDRDDVRWIVRDAAIHCLGR